jgi:hypothetical protein
LEFFDFAICLQSAPEQTTPFDEMILMSFDPHLSLKPAAFNDCYLVNPSRPQDHTPLCVQ